MMFRRTFTRGVVLGSMVLMFAHMGYANCLLGHSPPLLTTPQLVAMALRTSINPRLRLVDRALGFLTTPWKLMHVRGWVEVFPEASATGTVEHATGSTDRLYTVDFALAELRISDQPVAIDGQRYLRAELFPRAKQQPLPRPGQRVTIHGKLRWDCDGFLEIHPQHKSDVAIK